MLQNRNIAFFIDVDNVGLKSENYANVIEQLNGMGSILSGKIYGAGERKHKEIYADAELHGYRIERPMRVKRRGRKEFDPRIYVDVVDAVVRTPAIDAVCIVAQPADLVYLYSFLRGRGIKVIALDNADDASCAFIDEVVDLGIVLELKLPQNSQQRKPQPAPQPEQPQAAAQQDNGLDQTDRLLLEIERLRASIGEQPKQEQPAEQAAPEQAEQAPEQAEQPAEQQPAEEQPQAQSGEKPAEQPENAASIVDETQSLLNRIAEIRGDQQNQAEQQPAEQAAEEQPEAQPAEQPEQPEEQPKEPVEEQEQAPEQAEQQPAEQPAEEQPRQEEEQQPQRPRANGEHASNDSDLVRRIEEIRAKSQGGDDDYIEEIRKLLDGLE